MDHQTTSEQRPQHPLANYQFSSDELRVLRECNTESFFQRSLPLGTGFGVAAYLGIKKGFLQPNVKYGTVPKVVVSVIIGYFMGKFSYQQKCAEKLMRLPNSKLAEVLRQRKKDGVMGRISPDASLGVGLSLSPFGPQAGSEDPAETSTRSSVFNLDVENRPTLAGLDDIYRPSLDSATPHIEPELPLPPTKSGMTYEEMRQKNRDQYTKKYTVGPSETPLINRDHQRDKTMFDNERDLTAHNANKNKYGDSWAD